MSRLRRQLGNNLTNVAETKDLNEIKNKTGVIVDGYGNVVKKKEDKNNVIEDKKKKISSNPFKSTL